MKIQNQIEHALKCCVTNGKFALLVFSSILLFNSCKQSQKQDSGAENGQSSNIIAQNQCDKFIGKWESKSGAEITISKNQNQYFFELRYMGYAKFIALSENECLRVQGNGNDLVCLSGDNILYRGSEYHKINLDNSTIKNEIEIRQFTDEEANYVTDEEIEQNKNNKTSLNNTTSNLPFVGKRKFNFAGGSGTEEVIEIKKDGHTIIKSISNFGEFIDYEGPYKNIIDLAVGDESIIYYKITGNTISIVDANGKKEKNCKDCTASLEEF